MEGKRLTVDGTLVTANASPQRGTKPEQLGDVAKVSRTVREYLADLARENPVSESEEKPAPQAGRRSPQYGLFRRGYTREGKGFGRENSAAREHVNSP